MRNIIRSTTRATPRLLSARWPLTSTLKNQGTCCYHACQPSNRTSEHEKAALLASCDQSRTAEDRNTFVGNLPPLNGSDGIFDVEHVRRTYEVPADFEYPEIPDSISDNPKSVVYNASRRTFTANSGFVESGKKDVFRCHVQVDSAEEEQILGVGEGRQKKVAEKAAYLHVVAQLHKNGSLRRAYARLGKQQKPHENVSDEALAKERSPKYDVYEYAARFLSAPKFYHHVERPSVQQNDNPIFKTILELPEQGIRVEGIGRSVHDSETASCLRFFKRANRLEENSRCIKGDVPLRLTDAKKFWEWYRLQHPETKFALEGPRHAGQEGLLRAQVLMDGKPLGKTVELSGDAGEESQIELVAYLTAAIELQKNDIDLFSRYLNENRNKDGQVLRLNSPIQIGIDAESTGLMDAAIHRIPESQLPSKVEALTALESRAEKKSPRKSQQALRSLVLRRKLDAFNSRPEYTELRMKKAQLPMNHCRNQLIGMMEKNTYGIVMGAAGCGKTTQVPQILLEHAIVNDVGAECNIICTQPRRIAAISIARRVANERGEHLQESVGYQIRMDSKLPRQTGSIAYCTTGILLVRLQQDLDDILDNYSHLVIDEAHERDIDIDFLLTVLKRAIEERLSKGRKVPKVVLMSATIDTELFARYFQGRLPGGEAIDCPILNVPGRMFPVVERYFEDIWDMLQRDYPDQLGFLHKHDQISEYIEHERQFSHGGSLVSMVSRTRSLKTSSEVVGAISTDLQAALSGSDYSDASSVEKQDSLVPIALAAAVLAHLVRTTDQGAILVFLPGLDEILRLDQCLRVDNPLGVDFQDASKFKILLLHSRIQNADQSKVFDSVPEGCRKIILATNIAETSVTIPNVRFVVDTGKARERYYDHTREIAKLQCTWISKSSSTQRAGRAGRVQDGYYYALFSKSRRQNMRATGVPEMLHSDLQRVCLNVKALGFKVSLADFLAGAIEPPAPAAVEHAIQRLQNLEAVTDNEELTPLGRLLTLLPVSPALGKMIVLGVIFRCLDPMMILGAAGTRNSIFTTPFNQKRETNQIRRQFSEMSGSDQIALLNAFRSIRETAAQKGPEAAKRFADQHFLHYGTFQDIEAATNDIEKVLTDAGLIPYTAVADRYNNELGDISLNETSSNVPLLKALLTAGSPNNLAKSVSKSRLRTESSNLPTLIHPTSIISPHSKGYEYYLTGSELFTYSTMFKSQDGKTLFLRDVSRISPLTAALFGGRLREKPGCDHHLELNEWLLLQVNGEDGAAELLLEYRETLDQVLTEAFNNLSKGQSRRERDRGKEVEEGMEAREYLADESLRAFFVDGVVDLLDGEATALAKEPQAEV